MNADSEMLKYHSNIKMKVTMYKLHTLESLVWICLIFHKHQLINMKFNKRTITNFKDNTTNTRRLIYKQHYE